MKNNLLKLLIFVLITSAGSVLANEEIANSIYTYESPLMYSMASRRTKISPISIDLHYDHSSSLCGDIPDDVEEISIELAEKIKCSDDLPMIFQGDDVLSEAIICSETSELICLNGLGIIFSFPKVLNETLEWEYYGIKFNRSEELIRVSLWGQSVDVYYIVAKGKNSDFYGQEQHFWYSPEHGLMGFKIKYTNSTRTVDVIRILTGQCGFGASRSCYRK